jgi:hypothetical protein
MKYQLVQKIDGRPLLDGGLVSSIFEEENAIAAFEVRGFKFKGIAVGHSQLRAELRNQPEFEGLCGPMWGGEGVLRYEDWKAYEVLSR